MALESMAGGGAGSLARRHVDQVACGGAGGAPRCFYPAGLGARNRKCWAAVAGGEARSVPGCGRVSPVAVKRGWRCVLQVRGRLHLDARAVRALRTAGKSLLPVGVTAIEGRFERGDLVSCLDPAGGEVARGLMNYDVTGVAADRQDHPPHRGAARACG